MSALYKELASLVTERSTDHAAKGPDVYFGVKIGPEYDFWGT